MPSTSKPEGKKPAKRLGDGGSSEKAKREDAGNGHATAENLVAAEVPDVQRAQNIAKENSDVFETKRKKKGKSKISETDEPLTHEDLMRINTRDGLVRMLNSKRIKLNKVVEILQYEEELELLQIQLVKLQHWVQDKGERIAILYEGRDAAGKGGTIRRFTEHLNPRSIRVVALPKPTEVERGQWYFQRYARQLPNPGEIVFFDRSWYNRAVVEPVNGFCTKTQYDQFIRQVPEFEHMLYEDGVHLIKFWFSISKDEQLRRFESRGKNPLKQWKLSPVDGKAQELWDTYTHYKEEMFGRTHTTFSPWIVVQANNKKRARLETIRHVLSLFPYDKKKKSEVHLTPDPDVIGRFHRRSRPAD
jgi:polyphosphate kinase 2